MRYRFNNTSKRMDIGTYPMMSLKEARAEVVENKRELDKGRDPLQLKLKKKQLILLNRQSDKFVWNTLIQQHIKHRVNMINEHLKYMFIHELVKEFVMRLHYKNGHSCYLQ